MKTIKIEKPKYAWKVLLKGMKSEQGDVKWRKGKWNKVEGKIKTCKNGLHASKLAADAIKFVTPGIICKIEYKGDISEDKNKFACSEMRVIETYKFTKRMGVEFSIYCAKQCLKNFEKYNSDDKRPRNAIKAAKKWLTYPTTKNKDAARLAYSAAKSAAYSAERSSAYLAINKKLNTKLLKILGAKK